MAARQQRTKSKKSGYVTKQQVRDIVNSKLDADIETKNYYLPFTGSISSTTANTCISPIPQGVQSNNRTGDKVKISYVDINYGFGGGDATNYVRITLFRWLMNDSSDVLSVAKLYQNTAQPWMSFPVVITPNRFHIIYDKIIAIGSAGTGAAVGKIHAKVNSQLSFNAATTTGIGHYYIMLSSDSSAIPHPTYSIECNVGFEDA